MAAAPAFDWICAELEARSSLNRLEARGTVRLALRESGLDPAAVTGEQIRVVIERILPGELGARGIESAEELCNGLAVAIGAANLDDAPSPDDSPEAIFDRLGGDR